MKFLKQGLFLTKNEILGLKRFFVENSFLAPEKTKLGKMFFCIFDS